MADITKTINSLYESFDGNPVMEEYMDRHDVGSLGILTIAGDEEAALVAEHLRDRIAGKIVVEVGGGIGLLALHMSTIASHVYVIEASPVWTHLWMMFFMARKPKNVTFIFGAAQEMAGQLHADVAMFCTHSDAVGMRQVGATLANEVIDVYGEIVPSLTPELAALNALRQ